MNLDIEERGCGNFYVTLPGLVDAKQFVAFREEARSAGLTVTLRCDPVLAGNGSTEAVFGTRPTRTEAVKLLRRVVGRGFRGAVIKKAGCNSWSVILSGITSNKVAKALAAEARSAGFAISFEPS